MTDPDAVLRSLGWLAFAIACGALVAVLAAILLSDLLDERHRRRTGHVPRCLAPRGWDCSCAELCPWL